MSEKCPGPVSARPAQKGPKDVKKMSGGRFLDILNDPKTFFLTSLGPFGAGHAENDPRTFFDI